MNRHTLRLLALGTALVAGGYALGQGQSKSAAVPEEPKQQKLVRVATLNSIDANREFQANVQKIQAQRQAAVELNAAIEKEKDTKKQAEMKKQLDALMTKLNENNDIMAKAYGFSLTRNYTMVIEKSHIYMFVTDEEAAKVEAAEKAAAEKAAATEKKGKKK